MKIEKLIIQNLNSIEEAEIDFSNGVLAKEPLFLICGDTGSGKSTILDAITLALYDKASRYESVKSNEMIENGTNTKSTANILRKGSYDCKSEVYFFVKDTHYIASWTIHKTKPNKNNASNKANFVKKRQLYVVNGDLRNELYSNITQVNKAVEELVGLTYEQFIRSVMLAQGEFNTFLKSMKSEKAEILEMLTGTEVYSKIANAVKIKRGLAEQEKNDVAVLCAESKSSMLTPEDVSELESQRYDFEKEAFDNEREIKTIENNIAWCIKCDQLKTECEEAKQQYDKFLEIINSSEYKERESVVNDYLNTTKERELLNDLRHCNMELDKLEAQFDIDKELFGSLNYSLQLVKQKKGDLENRLAELTKWIECYKDNELLFENVDVVIDYLNNMSHIVEFKRTKKSLLHTESNKKKEIQTQLSMLNDSLETCKVEKQEMENLLNDTLKQFDSGEQQDLLDKQQRLHTEKNVCVEEKSKLINFKSKLEQYYELIQNIKNEKYRCDDLKLLLSIKERELSTAKIAFETKDEEFQKQKNMVDKWVKNLRLKLKNGEACPVCGSKEHYYTDEVIVDNLFRSIETEWERLKKSYENTKDEYNKISTNVNVLLNNIEIAEKKAETLLIILNKDCDGNSIPDIESINIMIDSSNTKISRIDEEIVQISERLKQIALIAKNIDEITQRKKAVEEKCYSIEKQYQLKQIEIQNIDLSLTAITTSIAEQDSKFNENVTFVNKYFTNNNWLQIWMNDAIAYVNRLRNKSQEWKDKKESLKLTENQIVTTDNLLLQSQYYVLEIINLIPDWNNLPIAKSIVADESIIAFLSAIFEKCKSRITERENIKSNSKTLEIQIDEFLSQNPDIGMDRLISLNNISDIKSISERNNELKNESIKAHNTYLVKKRDFDLHQDESSKPKDDASVDILKSNLSSLLENKRKIDERLSEIKLKLSLNEKNKCKSNFYERELMEKDRIYLLWEQLAKTIGTTDGNNFRDVAQAYTLRILLDRANYYLQQINTRYKLLNFPDSLAIMVQDLEMGGESRAASSLSGGETFLVSLSLALGLTSLNDEHFKTDILFIDEGFGSLDSESLDMVMNALENLHSLGRRVGIISHVDVLKERIPAQIQLIRDGKSSSRVVVTRV